MELDVNLLQKFDDLPIPSSYVELRSFFGLCLGLQAFHPSVTSLIAPLRRYKQAPTSIFNQPAFAQPWNHTIRSLTTHLWRPDFLNHDSEEPLRLFVDNSSLAHGVVLFQGDRLVAIWSVLNPQGYRSSSFSELAGFCKAIQGFKFYLINRPFTVYTDNRPVLAMFNEHNHSPFVLRHIAELQDLFLHPLNIKPIAGQANYLANILSRHKYLTQRKRHTQTSSHEQQISLAVAVDVAQTSSDIPRTTEDTLRIEEEEWYNILKQKLINEPDRT